MSGTSPSIGTRKESSLHRALKFRYSGIEGATETLEGGYVCDGRTEDGELVEVQTGSFGPLKEKVKKLCGQNKLRISHPIVALKYLELYDDSGRLVSRRKSPKKGNIWNVFDALVYAPLLPLEKNLSIELAVVEVIEKRVDDGKGSWRRKGVSIADRHLGAWRESFVLSRLKDYNQFVPFKKNEKFTVRDLAKKAGIDVSLARKTLYVLRKMNAVKEAGKLVNALVYTKK